MTPKPKVRCTGRWNLDGEWLFDYIWTCECGEGDVADGDWHDVVVEAAAHSRTHTAERIAEELEEWAGDEKKSRAGHAYWEGYLDGAAEGLRDSADLIRQHLVKEGP